jgi:Pvc16 N-terminal domain
MTGGLSIAAVTEAMRRRLQVAFLSIGNLSGGAQVTTGKPASGDSGQVPDVGANIYLYQVTPNAALRNRDLAMRNSDGDLVRRPTVALDLSYLLTFYGRDDLLEPQRLLGAALSALHAAPEFTLRDFSALIQGPEAVSYLADADLDTFPEPVRLSPVALTLEELSKVWTVFFQAAHRLSVAYVASPVLVAADLYPVPALPARRLDVVVRAGPAPRIERLVPSTLAFAPGTAVVVEGDSLSQPDLTLRLAGDTVPSTPDGGGGVRFALPQDVPAGTLTVEIGVAAGADGFSPLTQASLTVQPQILPPVEWHPRHPPTGWPAAGPVVLVNAHPAPYPDQRPVLLLNQLASGAGGGQMLTDALSLALTPDLASLMPKGSANAALPARLASALADQGYFTSKAAVLATVIAGQVWTVTEGAEVIAIRRIRGGLIAAPGLHAGCDPLTTTAFAAPGLGPGSYLVRLMVNGLSATASPLIAGERLVIGDAADTAALRRGRVSPGLRAALAAHGHPLGAKVAVRAQGPAEYALSDTASGQSFLARASATALTVYILDSVRAVYIGPMLEVPK